MSRENKPSYYTRGRIEVLEFILDQDLGFCLGNVIKYICRAGFKDGEDKLKDLEKAYVYLGRKIEAEKKKG